MKTKILLLAISLLFTSLFSQNFEGNWKGKLEVMGNKLPLIVHLTNNNGNFSGTMDSPQQGAMGIPLDKVEIKGNEILFGISQLQLSYKGKIENEKILGTLTQGGFEMPLNLEKSTKEEAGLNRPQTPKPPFDYNSEDVKIKNELQGNLLAGTLLTPKNFNINTPVLVMITGSGPQNRDEELFGHRPFLVIADYLAKKGIASLRMDDRGVGGSEKGKENPTSADFATDISSAVDYLAKKNFKNIGLIGHSEGGMIAPMVASQNKNVKFLVLLAAPGIAIEQLLLKQNEDIARVSGMDDNEIKSSEELNKKIYNFVMKYQGNNLEKDVRLLILNDLTSKKGANDHKDQEEKIADMTAKTVSNPWFVYFLKYRPELLLSKIKIPVLAINGSLDMQVSAKENLEGIKKSLSEAGNKNFETIEFQGLNHLLQDAKTGNPSEYGQIEETISPKVLEKISAWISGLNVKRP